MDFDPGLEVSVKKIDQTSKLGDALHEHSQSVADDKTRLYVVEDLSRDVVEVLGEKLGIDPLFFREYISDYWWYNTRDPWVELPDLQVNANERRFISVRYVQPRYFKNPTSYEEATKQAAIFSVLRRLENDRNHKTVVDEEGACIAMVRSKAAIWWRPAEAGKHGAVGERFSILNSKAHYLTTPRCSSS